MIGRPKVLRGIAERARRYSSLANVSAGKNFYEAFKRRPQPAVLDAAILQSIGHLPTGKQPLVHTRSGASYSEKWEACSSVEPLAQNRISGQ